MSQQPQTTNDSIQEDWDKSFVSESFCGNDASTPQNNVVFPTVGGGDSMMPGCNSAERTRARSGQGKRTLSELLKRHAEKGTDYRLSQEEATRLGEVLGQWASLVHDLRGKCGCLLLFVR